MNQDYLPYLATGMVVIDKLVDDETGAYLTSGNATVTASLFDDGTGAAITGAQALAAAYVASSSGKFRARVPDTAGVTLGQRVKVVANIVHSDGRKGRVVKVVPIIDYAGEPG